MSEEMLVRHCSPTLAGLKTANLINCPCPSKKELLDQLEEYNRQLNPRGVFLRLLGCGKGNALVYVYRPDRLGQDLGKGGPILGKEGYPCPDAGSCLRCLMRRLKESGSFPHEIGVFLGYPPEDVAGFIEHRGQGCKSVGAWKVYGDAEAAEKTFVRYKKCTDIYLKCHRDGCPLTRLTVRSGALTGG